jgi:hypothetical protein
MEQYFIEMSDGTLLVFTSKCDYSDYIKKFDYRIARHFEAKLINDQQNYKQYQIIPK